MTKEAQLYTVYNAATGDIITAHATTKDAGKALLKAEGYKWRIVWEPRDPEGAWILLVENSKYTGAASGIYTLAHSTKKAVDDAEDELMAAVISRHYPTKGIHAVPDEEYHSAATRAYQACVNEAREAWHKLWRWEHGEREE